MTELHPVHYSVTGVFKEDWEKTKLHSMQRSKLGQWKSWPTQNSTENFGLCVCVCMCRVLSSCFCGGSDSSFALPCSKVKCYESSTFYFAFVSYFTYFAEITHTHTYTHTHTNHKCIRNRFFIIIIFFFFKTTKKHRYQLLVTYDYVTYDYV